MQVKDAELDLADTCSRRPMQLEHEHTAEAIARRLSGDPRPNYLRDWVYGGIDGTVTTFAVVAGSSAPSCPQG